MLCPNVNKQQKQQGTLPSFLRMTRREPKKPPDHNKTQKNERLVELIVDSTLKKTSGESMSRHALIDFPDRRTKAIIRCIARASHSK